MKNIVIAIIIVILIAGGAWWYLNQGGLNTSTANKISVPLVAQNASGQSGNVVLEEVSEQVNRVVKPVVKLTIKVTSGGQDVNQPAHIHVGSCAD